MGSSEQGKKINVVYDNGENDQVSPTLLDSLIFSKRIDQFERSDGWADIGIDAIRGMGGPKYDGNDRRLS